MSGKVRSAAALTLLACMEAANACSMVMVNPLISGANAVSVRTMDYSGTAAGLDLVTSVNVVPKGSKLWYVTSCVLVYYCERDDGTPNSLCLPPE